LGSIGGIVENDDWIKNVNKKIKIGKWRNNRKLLRHFAVFMPNILGGGIFFKKIKIYEKEFIF
jgi:hypothetical protein